MEFFDMELKFRNLLNKVILTIKLNEEFEIDYIIKMILNYGNTGIVIDAKDYKHYGEYSRLFSDFLIHGDFIKKNNDKHILTENGIKVKKLGSFEQYYEWKENQKKIEEQGKLLDFKNRQITRRTSWIPWTISLLSLIFSIIIWYEKKQGETQFLQKSKEIEDRVESNKQVILLKIDSLYQAIQPSKTTKN